MTFVTGAMSPESPPRQRLPRLADEATRHPGDRRRGRRRRRRARRREPGAVGGHRRGAGLGLGDVEPVLEARARRPALPQAARLPPGVRGAAGAQADPRARCARTWPEPVEFIYPLEKPVWDRAYVGTGVGVYDVLGAGRGVPRTTCATCRRRRRCARSARRKPGAIKGGIAFYEGQLDDARHTMMIARTAAAYGALAAHQHPGHGVPARRRRTVVGAKVATTWRRATRSTVRAKVHRSTRPASGPTRSRHMIGGKGAVPGAGVQGRAHPRAARPDRRPTPV